MSKKKYRNCEVCGIREAHTNTPLFFANLPLDENRCRKWVQIIGNEDLAFLPLIKLHRNKFVCGNHFKKSDFHKSRLKKNAVPCLQLRSSPLSDDQIAEFPMRRKTNPGTSSTINQTFNEHNYATGYNAVACSTSNTTTAVSQTLNEHNYATAAAGHDAAACSPTDNV